MEIKIQIPEAVCVRCSARTSLAVQFVRPRDARNAKTPGFTAVDDHGGSWLVSTTTPEGWSQLLDDPTALLCTACTAGMKIAVSNFLHEVIVEATEPAPKVGSSLPVLAKQSNVGTIPIVPQQAQPRPPVQHMVSPQKTTVSSSPIMASAGAPAAVQPLPSVQPATPTVMPIPQKAATNRVEPNVSHSVACATPATSPIPQLAQKVS